MRKEKRLNLYAGIGGNRKHWKNVTVTAVESDPKIAKVYQNLYPSDTVIIGDAHEYLLQNYYKFNSIWSSPPCQSHSRMMIATRHKKRVFPDMRLYEEITFLTHHFKGNWVVENVKPYYDPLIEPSVIIGRHYLWSNFEIAEMETIRQPVKFIKNSSVAQSQQLKDWLGLQYDGNIYYQGNHDPCQVLRNCVHPELGRHVFNLAPYT